MAGRDPRSWRRLAELIRIWRVDVPAGPMVAQGTLDRPAAGSAQPDADRASPGQPPGVDHALLS
jgi:hypothetical protein